MSPAEPPRPSLGELTRASLRVGLLSFGGPAGQIALMHRIFVDEKKWIDEERYLHALSYCMLLPGPEAQQLATYVGWLLHGVKGGLIAGALFVIPGAIVVFGLAWLYMAAGSEPLVAAAFYGVKAAVVALVAEAMIRIGKRALKGPLAIPIAVVTFLALLLWQVPFPLLIIAAACVGLLLAARRPAPVQGPEAFNSPRPWALWVPALCSLRHGSGRWLHRLRCSGHRMCCRAWGSSSRHWRS